MEPMYSYSKDNGENFTKVFFMNDIVFCSEDVIHLINMEGVDAVSGIDIIRQIRTLHKPNFLNIFNQEDFETNIVYDTWVLRDM